MMVNKIAIHKKTISVKAKSGDFKPKNNIDQRIFKINWIPKKVKFAFFSQARYKEIPINRNKMVQTGAENPVWRIETGLI